MSHPSKNKFKIDAYAVFTSNVKNKKKLHTTPQGK